MTSEETFNKQLPSALTQLPRIPLDLVLENLDLTSFRNLRPASRQIAINSIYSQFFRSTTTNTSLKTPKSLQDHLSHPEIGPQLEKLTIVGTPYDGPPAEAAIKTKAQRSEFDYNPLRPGPRDQWNDWQRLQNLSQKKVQPSDEEQAAPKDPGWMQARKRKDEIGQEINLLSYILTKCSGLRTIQLDCRSTALRSSSSGHSRWFGGTRLSKPAIESWVFRIFTSALSYSDVKLSTLGIFPQYGGVATMLKMMPNLTSLDVYMICIPIGENLDINIGARRIYTKVFTHIAEEVELSHLKEVSLSRLPLQTDNLITFLKNHPKVEVLTLDSIILTTETWSTVFTRLECMPALESLRLMYLRTEASHLPVNLEPAAFEGDRQDKKKWHSWEEGYIMHTREMSKEEIKRGLAFKFSQYLLQQRMNQDGKLSLEIPRGFTIWNNTSTVRAI
ncbi:hypothetical protein F53441_1514 [Fusarium austroafricanum]|uniref:Uncharacterized protein n=1 Tax=Fusarium austroafricanum TaxID=2364996 RepID=A0A8H4KRX7_9HYPO|nr:hypothetical protein F53441_1514 [Fusarium austroafricanum]